MRQTETPSTSANLKPSSAEHHTVSPSASENPGSSAKCNVSSELGNDLPSFESLPEIIDYNLYLRICSIIHCEITKILCKEVDNDNSSMELLFEMHDHATSKKKCPLDNTSYETINRFIELEIKNFLSENKGGASSSSKSDDSKEASRIVRNRCDLLAAEGKIAPLSDYFDDNTHAKIRFLVFQEIDKYLAEKADNESFLLSGFSDPSSESDNSEIISESVNSETSSESDNSEESSNTVHNNF